jgi:hypothetical protein
MHGEWVAICVTFFGLAKIPLELYVKNTRLQQSRAGYHLSDISHHVRQYIDIVQNETQRNPRKGQNYHELQVL